MPTHFRTLVTRALVPLALMGAATSAHAQFRTAGAVFAMTNRAGNNEVVAFSRAVDGKLTQTGRFPTRGNGIGVDFDTQGGLMLSSDHRFLYACNPGSDDITVFAVNGTQLTFLQKIYAGDQPLSVSLSHSGKLLYAMDGSVAGNQITGFTIAADGKLAPLPDSTKMLSSPIAVPGDVVFSPDDRALVVTQKVASTIGFTLDVFLVGADGRPSEALPNQASGTRPFAATFDRDGHLFVVESGLPVMNNSAVSSYTLNTATGALSPLSRSVKDGQTDGCWVVITKDQRYGYTANFASGTIASFSFGPSGNVRLIKGKAAFSGIRSQPTDLAFSADDNYLYNLLRGTGGVAAYRIETNGSLTSLGTFGVGGGLPVADGASGLAAY